MKITTLTPPQGNSQFPSPKINFKKNVASRLYSFMFILILVVLGIVQANGQAYQTTGLSSDYNDPQAWTCVGAACDSVPSTNLLATTLVINHDIHYSGNNEFNIQQGGLINISAN